MHFLDSLKGLWDAMTAFGTVSMALATFIVILQGRRLRKIDDQHHQDTLRPICILTPFDGVDPQHWRDTLLTVHPDAPRPGFGIIEVRCGLRNIGPGPALNVGMMFRFHDMAGYTTTPWELGPLRAGECRGSKDAPLRIPIQLRAPFNSQDFAQIPGKSWELILVYDDVFGHSFHAMHPKNPLQMNRLYREGDTEGFMAPSQPWVTMGKGKPPVRSGHGLIVGFTQASTRSGDDG
jgi:hypothetical protein